MLSFPSMHSVACAKDDHCYLYFKVRLTCFKIPDFSGVHLGSNLRTCIYYAINTVPLRYIFKPQKAGSNF